MSASSSSTLESLAATRLVLQQRRLNKQRSRQQQGEAEGGEQEVEEHASKRTRFEAERREHSYAAPAAAAFPAPPAASASSAFASPFATAAPSSYSNPPPRHAAAAAADRSRRPPSPPPAALSRPVVLPTPVYKEALNIPSASRESGAIPQSWRTHSTAHSLDQDLSQHFVNRGSAADRPQNFLRDGAGGTGSAAGGAAGASAEERAAAEDRYGGDPELESYVQRRTQLCALSNSLCPYMAHKVDLARVDLVDLLQKQEFDVILIDPPWEEYYTRSASGAAVPSSVNAAGAAKNPNIWSAADLAKLPISELAAEPSLLFLWCGSNEHVLEAHDLIKRWGFQKAEDIVWIQTNKDPSHRESKGFTDANSIFQRTFEHCLLAIKGRDFLLRDRDVKNVPYKDRMDMGLVQFVAPGTDIDCFVSEMEDAAGVEEATSLLGAGGGAATGASADSASSPAASLACPTSTRKPLDFYSFIERYCVGRRRLELFGTEHNIRNGWLTLGQEISGELDNFDMGRYRGYFTKPLTLPPTTVTGAPAPPPPAVPFDARYQGHYLPFDPLSESLRPKSPIREGQAGAAASQSAAFAKRMLLKRRKGWPGWSGANEGGNEGAAGGGMASAAASASAAAFTAMERPTGGGGMMRPSPDAHGWRSYPLASPPQAAPAPQPPAEQQFQQQQHQQPQHQQQPYQQQQYQQQQQQPPQQLHYQQQQYQSQYAAEDPQRSESPQPQYAYTAEDQARDREIREKYERQRYEQQQQQQQLLQQQQQQQQQQYAAAAAPPVYRYPQQPYAAQQQPYSSYPQPVAPPIDVAYEQQQQQQPPMWMSTQPPPLADPQQQLQQQQLYPPQPYPTQLPYQPAPRYY